MFGEDDRTVRLTSSFGSSAKPCKLTNAEDVSISPETEATGVEMTFISATYTPADKHLKSTCDKYSRAQYVRSDAAGTVVRVE